MNESRQAESAGCKEVRRKGKNNPVNSNYLRPTQFWLRVCLIRLAMCA